MHPGQATDRFRTNRIARPAADARLVATAFGASLLGPASGIVEWSA
jgi:hypothetical protein